MFEKKHTREIPEPQLAAMIDVFSILIIFLIAGTVMGNSAVILPPELTPPKSISKESMVVAPQITLLNNRVHLSFVGEDFALTSFAQESDPEMQRFQLEVARFVQANKGKEAQSMINFVADRHQNYAQIFMVLKALRDAGMKTVLFVSYSGAGHV